MLPEIIFSIILVISLIGMAVILFRKIPLLLKVPEPTGDFQRMLAAGVKKGSRSLPGLREFSYDLYLQKLLSKIRILTLKTDHKTSNWLERLRQKKNLNNQSNNDDYWDKLKKAKEGK